MFLKSLRVHWDTEIICYLQLINFSFNYIFLKLCKCCLEALENTIILCFLYKNLLFLPFRHLIINKTNYNAINSTYRQGSYTAIPNPGQSADWTSSQSFVSHTQLGLTTMLNTTAI